MNLPELFSMIWETSLRMSLVLAVLLLLRPVLRRFIGGQWLGVLWLLVALRLLIPLPVLWPWAVELPWLKQPGAEASAASPQERLVVEIVELEMTEEEIARAEIPPGGLLTRKSFGLTLREFIGQVIWPLGVLIGLGFWIARLRAMHRLCRNTQPVTDDRVLRVFEAIPKNLRRGVNLRISGEIAVPALAGFRRPEIWLPQECLEELREPELRHILLHELGHARRGDLVIHHLFTLATCLHWFNPLVWLAARAARADREIACDAWVLQQLNPQETTDYGQTLMKIIENLSQNKNAAPGAVISMAASRRGVFTRMRAIKDHGPVAPWRAWVAILFLATLLLGFSATFRAIAAADEEEKPTTAETTNARVEETEKESASADSAAAQNPAGTLMAKLESLIIPTATFTNVALPEALTFLRSIAKQNGEAINFSIEHPEKISGAITATLEDVSLKQALDVLGQMTDSEWRIENQLVIFRSNESHLERRRREYPAVEISAKFVEIADSSLKALAEENNIWARLASFPTTVEDDLGVYPSLLSPKELAEVMEALGKAEEADLLSAPRIITNSGQRAVVRTAQDFRYASSYKSSEKSPTGVVPEEFEVRQLGYTLEVEPTAERETGRISLNIVPNLVELAGYTQMPQGLFVQEPPEDAPETSYYVPVFSEQRISTSIQIQNGQTFVVGGLRDLQRNTEKTTLLLFITARLADEAAE